MRDRDDGASARHCWRRFVPRLLRGCKLNVEWRTHRRQQAQVVAVASCKQSCRPTPFSRNLRGSACVLLFAFWGLTSSTVQED
mmetsp:Transcript_30935/g.89405  ORF Transcript_30935/g.89405 Transcript_30935/m.89405 type:complete len:83 (-) Transcript_30935:58-306(-)